MTKNEWNEIENLVCDVANGICDKAVLLYKLKRLRFKYGELGILLSTEADFTDAIEERLALYKKAVKLSQDPLDAACLTQSAESIAEIYIDELSDYDNGLIWVNKLNELISLYGSKYILYTPGELQARLNRLRIK